MYPKAMKALVLVYLFTLAAFFFLIIFGKDSKKADDRMVTSLTKESDVPDAVAVEIHVSQKEPTVEEGMTEQTDDCKAIDPNEIFEFNNPNVAGSPYSEAEVSVLERIVEAEAGGEDADGKLLVANVVLNRVRDEAFPNTITEVVFQRTGGVTQFSPVANGRYEAVTISEESKEAVERALLGEDISDGALYFAARKHAKQSSMRWFDENLTLLFQHGGHEFFK